MCVQDKCLHIQDFHPLNIYLHHRQYIPQLPHQNTYLLHTGCTGSSHWRLHTCLLHIKSIRICRQASKCREDIVWAG